MSYRIDVDFSQALPEDVNLLKIGGQSGSGWTVLHNGRFVYREGEPINEGTRNSAIGKLNDVLDIVTAVVVDEDLPTNTQNTGSGYWSTDFRWSPDIRSILCLYRNGCAVRDASKIETTSVIRYGVLFKFRTLQRLNQTSYVWHLPQDNQFIEVLMTKPTTPQKFAADQFKIRKATVEKMVQDGVFRVIQFSDLVLGLQGTPS